MHHLIPVLLYIFYRVQVNASFLNLTMKLVFVYLLLMFLSMSAMGADPIDTDIKSNVYTSPHDQLKHVVYTVNNIMGRRGSVGGNIRQEMVTVMLRAGKGGALTPPTANGHKSYFMPPSPPPLF